MFRKKSINLNNQTLAAKKKYSTFFLFSIIFLTPLPNLGIDIYTPSLPLIATYLHASASLVKISVSIYLITYGLGQILFGIIADFFGRRKILIVGLLFFIAATAGVLLSRNVHSLIYFRALQGLSASTTSVLTKSLITDKYKGSRLKKVSTYKLLAQILSIILAPFFGSIVQYYFDWKYSFIFLIFYALTGLFLSVFFIPETLKNKIAIGYQEIRIGVAEMMCHKKFLIMVINAGILYAIVSVFGVFGPFLIQNTFHESVFIYGISALICGMSYGIGSILSNKIEKKYIPSIFSATFFIGIILMFCLNFIKLDSVYLAILPVLFVMFGCGIQLPGIFSYMLGVFNKQAGMASGFIGTWVMLISGTIITFSSIIPTHDNILLFGGFYLIFCSASVYLSFLHSSDEEGLLVSFETR